MTAATISTRPDDLPGTRAVPAAGRPRGRVTFAGQLRSEWIKTWSLRSTIWSLAVAVVLMVGTTLLYALGARGDTSFSVSSVELLGPGGYFAQLVFAVLGVLMISGEYSTGQIRSTLVAVPRRTSALLAKVVVLVAVTVVTTLLGVVLALLASMPFHAELGTSLDLADGETLRILTGLPLVVAGVALFGFSIGAFVRSSPGALAIVLGMLLVVENVVTAIPVTFFERIAPFLPSNAGNRLVYSQEMLELQDSYSSGAHLTPWQGYGVLMAWVAVVMVLAAVLLRRRDA